jgi:hypothetical protein
LLDTRIALCFVSSLTLAPSVQRGISKCFCHDCCLFYLAWNSGYLLQILPFICCSRPLGAP